MKPPRLWLSVAIGLAAIGAADSEARQSVAPRAKIDVSKLGPQVGERVPDFRLRDQHGDTQTLQSIMGPRGAMLVFIRSADW
jgi:hypothetical protein